MKKIVKIYTDGACRGNPGIGGWGAILYYGDHEKKIYGAEKESTNNRMELMAAIQALKILKRSCSVELYTDSQYLKKGITLWLTQWKQRSWKTADKKPVKNRELWEQLDFETQRHQVKWRWIKGHAGLQSNEIADQLANQAIDEAI